MILGKIHKFKEKLASLSMSMKLCLLHALLSLKSIGVECIWLEVKLQKNFPSPGWDSISKSFRTCKLD